MKEQAVAGPACRCLVEMWNAAVADFLARRELPVALKRWAACYQGRGRGGVEFDALPEPFLGPLTPKPKGVFLALNPGEADLRFQGRNGIFAKEIRAHGSYSAWAASWPYLRKPWIAVKGRNRHHESRLRFLRTWTGDSTLQGSAMVSFELYPWHSARVTSSMRPDPVAVKELVWHPIAELAAPVFAFGAPWFPILEHGLGLLTVDRLGAGGRKYEGAVASRSVAVMKSENGITVIAEKHSGGAGPPSDSETVLLREALERWL